MMLLPVVAAPGGGGAVSASFAELADFVERQQMLLEQQRAEMEAKMQALVQHGAPRQVTAVQPAACRVRDRRAVDAGGGPARRH